MQKNTIDSNFSPYGYKIYRFIFIFLNKFEKTFTKMQGELY